jgi:hypothetical protein
MPSALNSGTGTADDAYEARPLLSNAAVLREVLIVFWISDSGFGGKGAIEPSKALMSNFYDDLYSEL